MFNDGASFTCKKMHEYSPGDGFTEITECMAEMIKFIGNEPSVGLFYIQQHTQNAVPNLVNLKYNAVEKSHEMTLHTEDTEDSITMIRSMNECGSPIAEEMIRDINDSLAAISAKQSKRGLMTSSSWSPAMWSFHVSHRRLHSENSPAGSGYFSNVFRSAKQKADNFQWPQLESTEKAMSVLYPHSTLPAAAASNSFSTPEAESDELPISSQVLDDPQELPSDRSLSHDKLLSLSENYQEFKADREAKLEEGLTDGRKK